MRNAIKVKPLMIASILIFRLNATRGDCLPKRLAPGQTAISDFPKTHVPTILIR